MDFKKKAAELVSEMTYPEKLSQLLYNAPAIPRLGIPEYNWWNEALHGYARSGTATVFPQAIGLAASFSEDDVYKTAEAISEEARAKYNAYRKKGSTKIYQGLTLWSPNINIFRDPRWGRGHETYGEDPFLTAVTGTAFVKGIQPEADGYRKADATLKHFAAHSGPESMRHSIDVRVSDKDLYETYLYAFRYIIDNAKPAAVMGAYNRLNGLPCCASPVLLEKILREEFGFEGYVVSDCGAICDINLFHKITANEAESSAMAINAGCDLNCGSAYSHLKVACSEGKVTEETVTRACVRLFETRLRLGMRDKTPFDSIEYNKVCCKSHFDISRKMSEQAFVMLKNNGILPLSKTEIRKIAVIGPNADSKDVLVANYNGTPSVYYTMLRGIQETFEPEAEVLYSEGCHLYKGEVNYWDKNPSDEAALIAQEADLTVLCLGLSPMLEGEEGDAAESGYKGDRGTLSLPKSQLSLYNRIKESGKPIIVVNLSGSCVNLSFASDASAILQGFYPGQFGGKALGSILTGEADPGGRLPVTFYEKDSDLPPFDCYDMKDRTYRYFNGKPLYPFGFGLSYATFEYSSPEMKDGKIILKITNTSKNHGFAVPQLYATYIGVADAPRARLVGFSKLFLKAGESAEAVICPAEDYNMLFDNNGRQYEFPDVKLFVASDSSLSYALPVTVHH